MNRINICKPTVLSPPYTYTILITQSSRRIHINTRACQSNQPAASSPSVNNNSNKQPAVQLKNIVSIPKQIYHQWRHSPKQTFQHVYTNDKYLWWLLVTAYLSFGCIVVYKQYYQPIVLHPTVKQTLEFINSSALYKQYCIDTHQLNETTSEPIALKRGVYYDGKHSYRKSHLIWQNYTPNGSTVYIACDGINLAYIPKLDANNNTLVPLQHESTLLSNTSKHELNERAIWKLHDIRIWFTDINKCYNYNFDTHQFQLSNNIHDIDIFQRQLSSAYIGSLGSEESSGTNGIITNSQLNKQCTSINDLHTNNKQSWNEYLSDTMTETRFWVLTGLISIPFGIGLYNRSIYRRTEGFRLITTRLNSNHKLQQLYGNNYVISNKYTGTVDRVHANFNVNIHKKINNELLGTVTIQAKNNITNHNISNWNVSYAELQPVNGRPVSITV